MICEMIFQLAMNEIIWEDCLYLVVLVVVVVVVVVKQTV